jgi:hypothetical protein
VKRPVQQQAGVIAGERPAGPVRAVHPRREADHEQPVAHAAEGRDRPAVVVGVGGADRVEVTREARAEPAERLEGRAVQRPAATHVTAP